MPGWNRSPGCPQPDNPYDEKDGAHSAEAAQVAFQLTRELPKLDIQDPADSEASGQESIAPETDANGNQCLAPSSG